MYETRTFHGLMRWYMHLAVGQGCALVVQRPASYIRSTVTR